MKVKELISTLQTYDPEEHIIVQWYCQEDIEDWDEKPATTKQWEVVVDRYDFAPHNFGDDIFEQLQEVMEEDDG
tara:strand:+ start:137 stop:358 length:222 start_codon:yes stop_codon:yes gene_type:complete